MRSEVRAQAGRGPPGEDSPEAGDGTDSEHWKSSAALETQVLWVHPATALTSRVMWRSHLCLALLSSLVTVKPYSLHWDEGYFMASQALPPAPTGLPLTPFTHPVHWFDWVLAYGVPRLVSRRKGV